MTGADVLHDDANIFLRYGIYYFSHGAGNPVLSFTTGSNATLASIQFFAAVQGIDDEFWAIDNVQVSIAPIPEPAAGAWWLGTVGMGVALGSRRHRQTRA